jgi:hypothetical protein
VQVSLHSEARQNDNAGLPARFQEAKSRLLRCSSCPHTTRANMTTAQAVLPPSAISIFSTRNVLTFVGVWFAYHILKALYNISPLHPLNGIPGPKLAAATYLPEFYHDVVRYGCYTKEIAKMHEKYGEPHIDSLKGVDTNRVEPGPIVRISPHEVHCNDISFADEIYAVGGRKRDKPVHQINGSA